MALRNPGGCFSFWRNPMENGMQIFERSEFGSVRVVEHNGEPWFVASDVARALGYANPAEAIQDHCKKVNKINHHSKTLPPTPPVNILIIPESDVYRLVMRSNLPDAERFQDWVVEDVLPSIRKRGGYNVHQQSVVVQSACGELPGKMLASRILLESAGIVGNQCALALDNLYKKETGQSALEAMEIKLVAPQQEQLLTPTQLGQLMGGLSGKKVNQRLIDEGFQIRLPGGQLEPTAKGIEAGGILMDTSKKHNDGTPVRQLKWPSSMAGKIALAA